MFRLFTNNSKPDATAADKRTGRERSAILTGALLIGWVGQSSAFAGGPLSALYDAFTAAERGADARNAEIDANLADNPDIAHLNALREQAIERTNAALQRCAQAAAAWPGTSFNPNSGLGSAFRLIVKDGIALIVTKWGLAYHYGTGLPAGVLLRSSPTDLPPGPILRRSPLEAPFPINTNGAVSSFELSALTHAQTPALEDPFPADLSQHPTVVAARGTFSNISIGSVTLHRNTARGGGSITLTPAEMAAEFAADPTVFDGAFPAGLLTPDIYAQAGAANPGFPIDPDVNQMIVIDITSFSPAGLIGGTIFSASVLTVPEPTGVLAMLAVGLLRRRR